MSFCSQISMILQAGISSIEGLAIMKEGLPDGEGKKILETLYEHMEMSGNLAQSMKETEVFPEYVCSMGIRADGLMRLWMAWHFTMRGIRIWQRA